MSRVPSPLSGRLAVGLTSGLIVALAMAMVYREDARRHRTTMGRAGLDVKGSSKSPTLTDGTDGRLEKQTPDDLESASSGDNNQGLSAASELPETRPAQVCTATVWGARGTGGRRGPVRCLGETRATTRRGNDPSP